MSKLDWLILILALPYSILTLVSIFLRPKQRNIGIKYTNIVEQIDVEEVDEC